MSRTNLHAVSLIRQRSVEKWHRAPAFLESMVRSIFGTKMMSSSFAFWVGWFLCVFCSTSYHRTRRDIESLLKSCFFDPRCRGHCANDINTPSLRSNIRPLDHCGPTLLQCLPCSASCSLGNTISLTTMKCRSVMCTLGPRKLL